MNKQRGKDIDGAVESATEAKDMLNEQKSEVEEIAADIRGGESSGIRTRLVNLKSIFDTASGKIGDAVTNIETAKGEEEEYKENMPDSMKDGDKGSAADEAISNLDDAYGNFETAQEKIDAACTTLEELAGDEDREEWSEEDAAKLDEIAEAIDEVETEVDNGQSSAESATSG